MKKFRWEFLYTTTLRPVMSTSVNNFGLFFIKNTLRNNSIKLLKKKTKKWCSDLQCSNMEEFWKNGMTVDATHWYFVVVGNTEEISIFSPSPWFSPANENAQVAKSIFFFFFFLKDNWKKITKSQSSRC